MTSSHEAVVDRQFGAQAEAYLTSAVHAAGPDLVALVACVGKQPAAHILDLGCGAGHVSFALSPNVDRVIAYDLSNDMLRLVANTAADRGLANIETEQGAAETLPFPDAHFDAVVCRYSAHHWRDLEAGLRETARVLKPHGQLVIVDSISPGVPLLDTLLQATEVLRDPSHVRDYTRAEWNAALVRAGFEIKRSESYKLRIEFPGWIARMKTSSAQAAAILTLQAAVGQEARDYFAIGADGSFDLDAGLFDAVRRT